MRFLALFRKEFREGLPWMLLAAVVLLAIGGLDMLAKTRFAPPMPYAYPRAGQYLNSSEILSRSPLEDEAALLLLTACGLGLVLAGRQFLLPSITKEWPFTFHRSISRRTVLAAKCGAACAALGLGVGATWTLLFLWASQPGVLRLPVEARTYWEGWIYILLGVVSYLAAAVTSLSTARWYTTRLFPLAIAAVVIGLVISEWSMPVLVAALLVGLALPAAQLVGLMLDREF